MSAVAELDPGPMARLQEQQADPATPGIVFQRLCDGETLRDIAKAWKVPVGLFTQWFTEKHLTLFDAALKVRADQLANEALERADAADPETVGVAKLQADTRLKLAAQWDRARYGAKDSGPAGGGVTVIVDRSCGGTVEVTAGGVSARIENASPEASGAGRIVNEIQGAH